MRNTLIATSALAACIALGACSNDSQPETAPAAAATALQVPEATTHPMTPSTSPPQVQPAPAATTAGYQIPPFPISNVEICDRYASEARRCLNQYGTDKQRQAYEKDIRAMLKKVTPKEGEAPNGFVTGSCHRGLDSLALRFKQCTIQK